MSAITTHILDVSRGRPAVGVEVALDLAVEDDWRRIGEDRTDDDGRVASFASSATERVAGIYRLTFEIAKYFSDRDVESFYPRVVIEFNLRDEHQHYHVPLLLSPFGYSTYRGS